MEVGLAVGGSVLSAVLQVVFDRISPTQKFLGLFQGKPKLQLKRLERTLQAISVVLEDAENKQERYPAVKSWFNSLKHAVYQAEDLLDEINTERMRIKVRHHEGNLSDTNFTDQFMEELMPRLEEICETLESFVSQIAVLGLEILHAKQKRSDRTPSTSLVIPSRIFGRDDEKEKIIQMMLSDEGATDISVIPITGMGGVGKTTLAQLVYNDERVKNRFETRAWVCVSEEFDVHRATQDLLMEVNSSVVDDKDDLNRMQVKLKDNLEGKRFIIILDDIWNENYNDCQRLMIPLNSGSRGSKIIITTRNEKIALMLQSEPFHCLQPIPHDQSWSLFKLHAFDNRALISLHEVETIGKLIVERCKGLPLAIKTIAGALRSQNDIREWRPVLSSDIWMVGGDVLPALSLSYKLLPSRLKCCFAFCAVFPKDIPFDKEEVVLLWMANDLVQPSSKKVARNYFEELRSRSFFEMGKNNEYLMHDMVNDLARYVSGNFCARIEDYQSKDLHQGIQGDNDLPSQVLHFSYQSSGDDTFKRFRGLAHVQGLRTFLPIHQFMYSACITPLFFSDILPKLRHIRSLSLHKYSISVIPDSIGDLKHLRLLNLAWTDIENLPNDITKCLNLQTLILTGCWKLRELPEDMRLLINLQHLDIRGVGNNVIDKMERWLSKLKGIHNLSIVVDKIHGSVLEQLGKVQPCQSLVITELENIVNVEIAQKAELGNNKSIENLTLEWSGVAESSEDELNIFTKLQPHTNTKILTIKGYRGTTFSSWLGDSAFCNMESLSLEDCRNCFHLPPLGQLTGLKRLKISGMDGITKVGEEFYGNSSIRKPFQILEELKFSRMAEWTTWNTHPDNVEFLSLKQFCIENCPKLVGDIPFHHQTHISLQSLTISNCNNILSFPKGGLLAPNLKKFIVQGCNKLKSLPEQMHTQLSSLCEVQISECPELECFPEGGLPSCLETLCVRTCKKLMISRRKWGLQRLSSLIELKIIGLDDKLFPEEDLFPTCLQSLSIWRCQNLEALNHKGFQDITSLRYLSIGSCPKLRYLPEDGLASSLSQLHIYNCPKLKGRIEKGKGEDWAKVSHIPIIDVDSELIS